MSGVTTGVDVFGSGTGGSSLSPDFFGGYFGDGSDGTPTISGTFTAPREMHYDNLTIPAGTTFKPAGHRIFVRGTLTIDATASFNDDGNNSISQAGATALGTRNYLVGNGLNGGNGQAQTSVVLANGFAGAAATNTSLNNSGQLTSGGRGGNTSARAGGIGGVSAVTTPSQKWNGRAFVDGRFSAGGFNGGSGGGGGGIEISVYTSGTFISGGGGGGGGVVWIAARNIINNGRISANGGKGFNGTLAVGTGECGGGGGGGGGNVAIVTTTAAAALGTIEVNGGIGGTGVFNVGTGANIAGVAGVAGSIATLIVN